MVGNALLARPHRCFLPHSEVIRKPVIPWIGLPHRSVYQKPSGRRRVRRRRLRRRRPAVLPRGAWRPRRMATRSRSRPPAHKASSRCRRGWFRRDGLRSCPGRRAFTISAKRPVAALPLRGRDQHQGRTCGGNPDQARARAREGGSGRRSRLPHGRRRRRRGSPRGRGRSSGAPGSLPWPPR